MKLPHAVLWHIRREIHRPSGRRLERSDSGGGESDDQTSVQHLRASNPARHTLHGQEEDRGQRPFAPGLVRARERERRDKKKVRGRWCCAVAARDCRSSGLADCAVHQRERLAQAEGVLGHAHRVGAQRAPKRAISCHAGRGDTSIQQVQNRSDRHRRTVRSVARGVGLGGAATGTAAINGRRRARWSLFMVAGGLGQRDVQRGAPPPTELRASIHGFGPTS